MADGSARLGVGLDFGLKRQDVFDLVSLLCACSVGGAYPWSGQCNELIIARGNVGSLLSLLPSHRSGVYKKNELHFEIFI